MPRGPRLVLTASASALADSMLDMRTSCFLASSLRGRCRGQDCPWTQGLLAGCAAGGPRALEGLPLPLGGSGLHRHLASARLSGGLPVACQAQAR